MVNIIVKKYDHFNRALPNWNSPKGRYINSKSQYDRAIKESGLVPFEQAEEIRKKNEEKARRDSRKVYPETISFIESVKSKADKKGNVKLSDRQVDYMISSGAIKDRDVYADKLPKHYQNKGGFK